jgi:L-asparaginase
MNYRVSFLRLTAFAAGLLFASIQAYAADDEKDLPVVLVIATGGTIAGVQDDPTDPERYRAGTLSADQIMTSVPALSENAIIEAEQFSNIPSPQIMPSDWLRLSRLVTERLQSRDDVAGIVITHGTDRMEETAFFLHLTVDSDKPVVLVGAQHPATHRSPDGPANLLAAVRTVASPEAVDRGVMIVMDERILSAREVRKDYPRVGGFATGQIGVVGHDGPEFLYRPSRPHTHRSEFKLTNNTTLPDVDMLITYSGGVGPRYETLPAGLVLATTGTTCEESLALQVIARQGVPIVAAFPTGQSVRRSRPIEDSAPEWVREPCSKLADDPRWEGKWVWSLPARLLTPQKARILLMLALSQSSSRDELEEIFQRY